MKTNDLIKLFDKLVNTHGKDLKLDKVKLITFFLYNQPNQEINYQGCLKEVTPTKQVMTFDYVIKDNELKRFRFIIYPTLFNYYYYLPSSSEFEQPIDYYYDVGD